MKNLIPKYVILILFISLIFDPFVFADDDADYVEIFVYNYTGTISALHAYICMTT